MTRMRIFWSVYCILLGAILLLKLLLRWDAAAWNLAIALLCLQSGVFLLTGGFGLNRRRTVPGGGLRAFFSGTIRLAADAPALSLLFSHADVEFDAPLSKLSRIDCAFSSVTIRIPQGVQVRTVQRCAFGVITAPSETLTGFGERVLVVGDGLQTQLLVHCLFSDVRLLD